MHLANVTGHLHVEMHEWNFSALVTHCNPKNWRVVTCKFECASFNANRRAFQGFETVAAESGIDGCPFGKGHRPASRAVIFASGGF